MNKSGSGRNPKRLFRPAGHKRLKKMGQGDEDQFVELWIFF